MRLNSESRIALAGLLGALLILTLFEQVVRHRLASLTQRSVLTTESIIVRKQHALPSQPSADILFLGDSTVEAGIDAELFTQISGKRALNLGLVGDLITYGDYWMLGQYLKTHPAPKSIVVWHTVDVWPRPLNQALFGFTRPSAEDQALAFRFSVSHLRLAPGLIHWPVKILSQNLQGFLYRLSDVFRLRIWIRNALSERMQAMDIQGLIETLPAPESRLANRVTRQIRDTGDLDLSLSQESRDWFDLLVKRAEAHGIVVYLARSPLHERLASDEGIAKSLAAQNKELDNMVSRYPAVVPLATSNLVFPDAYCHDDKDHLNSKGRSWLTRYYAHHLK